MNTPLTNDGSTASRSDVTHGLRSYNLDGNSSLRAAMDAFEAHMQQQGFSENTAKAFMSDLGILTQFIGAGTAVRHISTSDLNRFSEWLVADRGVPCSPKSLARRVTTLKVFFGWLSESGILDRDPAEAVIHRSVTAPLPEILSDEAVEQVLAVTEAMRHGEHPDARPHLLFTLLLHTGIKKSEAVSIVLNHIDVIDPMHPVLWIRYANPRRRHKERKLALPEWWPTVLAEYQAQYRIHDALFPWTARNLEYVLRDIAEAADLGRGLSFEMIRWTCAVRDHRAGMSDTALRQKLGISKITWREVRLKVVQMADRGH